MKCLRWTAWKQVPALLCALLLSACLAGPTVDNSFYTLQPTAHERLGQEFAGFKEIILIMPVRLAPQLQGRGLTSERSSNEEKKSRNHLWAGPLDQQIAETIAGNLKVLLGTDNVALYPGPRFGVTRYQVEIEIDEFSGDGQFTAQAVYTLSDTVRKTMVQRKSFQQTRSIDQPGYSGYVSAASQALGALSKEVAAALRIARQSEPAAPFAHE